MKRSALVIAVLLLGSAACDGGPDTGHSQNAGRSPDAVKLPTAKEARRVVADLAAKEESESLDPGYWRGIYEGPLLDQTLAQVGNTRKRGRDNTDPSNRPERDARVHTWTAHAPGAQGDAWILGAQQVSAHTVGDSKNRVHMAWSLYHQKRPSGQWRKVFVSHAPTKKTLPRVASGKKGAARTVSSGAGLSVSPIKACGELSDYVTGKDGSSTRLEWSEQIDTFRSTSGDTKALRKAAGGAQSVNTRFDARRSPLGPVWRTDDGGALVACVSVGELTADMGPGRWTRFGSSGWDGTSGIKWSKYTQSTMRMEFLKIPADSSDSIHFATESIWPYKFEGTKYTG